MHNSPSTNPELRVEDNPGVHIVMEGREVFKHAVKAMEDAVTWPAGEDGNCHWRYRSGDSSPGKYENPQ